MEVPGKYSELLKDGVLERRVLRALAKTRLQELEEELEEAEKHIERFQEKHSETLEEFEKHLEGREEHEEYNEWFFWSRVRDEKQDLIDRIEAVQRE